MKKETEVETKHTVYAYYCDVCGKEISYEEYRLSCPLCGKSLCYQDRVVFERYDTPFCPRCVPELLPIKRQIDSEQERFDKVIEEMYAEIDKILTNRGLCKRDGREHSDYKDYWVPPQSKEITHE